MPNPNRIAPTKAYDTLYKFIIREKSMRERFLMEPRRTNAVAEADAALDALHSIAKHAELKKYTQTQLFSGYGGKYES